MFIEVEASGYRGAGGEQFCRGQFLILACDKAGGDLWGVVRKVTLAQFGQFMMGRARVRGHTIIVSGAYGSDGLTVSFDRLPDEVRPAFTQLTETEAHEFWHGEGGWNSAGSEGPAMKKVGKRILALQRAEKHRAFTWKTTQRLKATKYDHPVTSYRVTYHGEPGHFANAVFDISIVHDEGLDRYDLMVSGRVAKWSAPSRGEAKRAAEDYIRKQVNG